MESTILTNKSECLSFLNTFGVKYDLLEHDHVINMVEMEEKVKLQKSPFIKNLLYADKKKNLYLVLAKSDTKVGKKYWSQIGVAPGNVRLANEDALTDLKVKKGAMNPFALLNDVNFQVKNVILDKNLESSEYVAFHPIENNATVEFTKSEFDRFIQHCNRKLDVIKLEEEEGQSEPVKKAPAKVEEKVEHVKGETRLCIEYKKEENFAKWYNQVITKSEMINYYEVSGCYVLRPWSYGIWEIIQKFLDEKIQSIGVQNCYFPMFVTEKALNTEQSHVEGFAPEVAWVTEYGNSKLNERIAIRPTSETIMYPIVADWIQSHRDLPIKLNQWTNVVRWEFKHPTPFLRTREFLWQEGHTLHSTTEEADEQTYQILDYYEQVYHELLAVPVVKGIKSELEKFAGGNYTTTVEAFIPQNGRGIQGATSHHLGQNFSKMFNIQFSDVNNGKTFAYQTSWGLTTRTIGVMVMVHGDNKGLVLPPRLSKIQVVVVPVPFKEDEGNQLNQYCNEIFAVLKKAGVRVFFDDRDTYTPGWKYNHWELKGVPLRLEVGPRDLQNSEVRSVKRNDNQKSQLKFDTLAQDIPQLLEQIQKEMFDKACQVEADRRKDADDWASFMTHLNGGNRVETPWCKETVCEEDVKKRSGEESVGDDGDKNDAQAMTGAAKTLCIPLKQRPLCQGQKCFACSRPAKVRVLWGRSY